MWELIPQYEEDLSATLDEIYHLTCSALLEDDYYAMKDALQRIIHLCTEKSDC